MIGCRSQALDCRKESHLNCYLSPAASILQPFSSDPCGIRTQPNQRERLATSPEVERAMLSAHQVLRAGQEALESSSADFQSAAKPSQLQTRDRGGHRSHKKKPDVEVTPGFER